MLRVLNLWSEDSETRNKLNDKTVFKKLKFKSASISEDFRIHLSFLSIKKKKRMRDTPFPSVESEHLYLATHSVLTR